MSKNPLQQRLESERFLHAVDYVKASAQGLKKLTTSELQHLNQMLTSEQGEAWRFQAMSVTIPGGQVHEFNLISNPIAVARELISEAEIFVANGKTKEAAVFLYLELVQAHLFKEANRRTAVLAMVWVLSTQDQEVDAKTILDIPIGNLRDSENFKSLKSKLIKTL